MNTAPRRAIVPAALPAKPSRRSGGEGCAWVGAADANAPAPHSEPASQEVRLSSSSGPAGLPALERDPMEAPEVTKAAAVDPDPPKSPGEAPEEAPAQGPGSDTPASESPAYRLQDFDTLATVGECETWGPGPQGRSAAPPGHAGVRQSSRSVVPRLPPVELSAWSRLLRRPRSHRRPESWSESPTPVPRVPPWLPARPTWSLQRHRMYTCRHSTTRVPGLPTGRKFLELTSHWGPQAPSPAGTPRGRGSH